MKQDVVLMDVIPRSLGIEIEIVGERGHMRVIIPKNTSIPTSKKRIIPSINNTVAVFPVYQGENTKVKDNILLDEFELTGLTLGPDGKSRIEVCFSLDTNGILLVSAEEISTGQRKSITITKI
ncbi:heat shock cognate 70 kDa protein-like protein [Tanacetum coccineum]